MAIYVTIPEGGIKDVNKISIHCWKFFLGGGIGHSDQRHRLNSILYKNGQTFLFQCASAGEVKCNSVPFSLVGNEV